MADMADPCRSQTWPMRTSSSLTKGKQDKLREVQGEAGGVSGTRYRRRSKTLGIFGPHRSQCFAGELSRKALTRSIQLEHSP